MWAEYKLDSFQTTRGLPRCLMDCNSRSTCQLQVQTVNAQSEHAVQLTDEVELVVRKKREGQEERKESTGVQEDSCSLFQKAVSTEPGKVVMLSTFSIAPTCFLACIRMCIFCLSRFDSFTEEGLNIHYWRSCPMLMRCAHCKQVVEIATLSQHLLGKQ